MSWVQVAVPRQFNHLFTYAIPEEWTAEQKQEVVRGRWVEVPFGKAVLSGCVVDTLESLPGPSTYEIRGLRFVHPVQTGLSSDVFEMCVWAHRYYQTSLGELLQCALPSPVLKAVVRRQARPEKRDTPTEGVSKPRTLFLNDDQTSAVKAVLSSEKPILLHGVTGSGKTEVYMDAARQVLAEGRTVLMLVPEIALTPQLHHRIEEGLGEPVALWHSALSDTARAKLWVQLREGSARVVVGARSAIFVPLENIGLIVVDEEHDASYKQEERARYHARDLAMFRGRACGARVVLGSATPSLETLERVRDGKFNTVHLQNRFGGASMPQIELVDLTSVEKREDSQALFADSTLRELADVLDRGEQAIVFLNRRGFASLLLCEDCGWTPECEHCSLSLTVYQRTRSLRCHVCNFRKGMPERCDSCQGHQFRFLGAGTESLETQLPTLIPSKTPARALRLDRDRVTSHTRLEKTLDSFRRGEFNLLLGTQMLVKGHDFPNVTLVVIVLADGLFRFPDFRASERAYQILTQVSGRAGRAERAGKVLIQTFQPGHPVLEVLTGKKSVEEWMRSEADLRREFHYPPYYRMARVRVESQKQEEARAGAERLADSLVAEKYVETDRCELLGPSEAPVGRVKAHYRWDLWIKSSRIEFLHQALTLMLRQPISKSCRVHVDVDPQGP